MEALRTLRDLPEWAAYSQALAARYEQYARKLLDCASFEEYREVLGALRAYEEMIHLNDLVVGKADELDAQRTRNAESERQRDSAARASLISSRLWAPGGVPVRG